MVRFSINILKNNNFPIIFYWCFFYFTQFTFLGDYFDFWIMPSSYLVIIFGFGIIFFYQKFKLISKYLLIAIIPLSFDILLNIEVINYWLFALKYIFIFITINIASTYKSNPFLQVSKIIFNFYLISFIVSMPFLFGLDFLPEIDPTILRKNIEGNGQRNLYSVTTLFSAYLTGDIPIFIFNIPIFRFSSFHFEPSNFTLYFIPLTLINWKYLHFTKKMLASFMILLSLSVTSFLVLPIIFIVKFLYDNKYNIATFIFLLLIFSMGVLISSNYIIKNTSIGNLVYYKVYESSSVDASTNQKNIFNLSNLSFKNSFNKLPAQTKLSGVNPFSFVFWFFFLISVCLHSYRKKKSNRLALTYFLLHGLKSVSHMYPSFFLLFLLFVSNRVETNNSPKN